MQRRTKFIITGAFLSLIFIFVLMLNSSLGVDSDETITNLNRPEIVGERDDR